MECSNHIRIHHVQEDNNSIVVCGTDAIQPSCKITLVSEIDLSVYTGMYLPCRQVRHLPHQIDAGIIELRI